MIRTRFAPSPTGMIHLGNIRSALYAWAFARAQGGAFILRIEDTDTERSTPEATTAILQSMEWLGLTPDEGPFFQSERLPRYQAALQWLKDKALAYPCYMSSEELEALRARQMQAQLKPRYDGTWRPEPGKTLPPVPSGVSPVWRFKTPLAGSVIWEDLVKGRIEIQNAELDDLVLLRADGSPTYNFCVSVDDWEMGITHVVRGDDHVNNTPRQIHLYQALGAPVPRFAHLPSVLDASGAKLSKRNGARSVLQYRQDGFLAEALVNYLARLGWSHGDTEIFSRTDFVRWFDLTRLHSAPACFDEVKLKWVNAEHIKRMNGADLAEQVAPFLGTSAQPLSAAQQAAACELFKDRCATLPELAAWLQQLARRPQSVHSLPQWAVHATPALPAALEHLAEQLRVCDWQAESIAAAIKQTLKVGGLKMPQLAMPLRLLLLGQEHSPAIDKTLALFTRAEALARIAASGA